jgi:hypothetical protein
MARSCEKIPAMESKSIAAHPRDDQDSGPSSLYRRRAAEVE